MKVLLVRVGIDSEYGGWNAPVNPSTGEFAYVPIPETSEVYSGYEKPYEQFKIPCQKLGVDIPKRLFNYKSAHLDPDFSNLAYGDNNQRGRRVCELEENDIVAFYAGLRSTEPKTEPERKRKLIYALIGLYVVDKVIPAECISEKDWYKNAHTRRPFDKTDIIVFAKSGLSKSRLSGRLERCIQIGGRRDNADRVTCELLDEWGGLSVKNGYIQRSATLPWFCNPEKFYEWFKNYKIQLVESNN